ncbi:flippase [Candidatus Woesearchaeota archaeon]|nr:flippase [Candidatus Woesearchaeota archaeon]
MTNYTKKALLSAVIIFVTSIVGAFFGYIVRVFFARNLTIEEFGLFYAVIAFLGLLGFLRSLGFDRVLITFIPKFKAKSDFQNIKNSILYSSIVLLITNLAIIILIFIFADFLGINYFHDSFASAVLKLMAISFFIDSFTYIVKFSFQGFQSMGFFSSIDVVRMMIILLTSYVGFKLGYGLISPAIAYIITPVTLLLIYTPILIRKIVPNFLKVKSNWNYLLFKSMSTYSFHLILMSTIGTAFRYTDSVLLTYFRGLHEVAIYNAILPTALLMWYFPMAINNVIWPMASEFWSKGKIAELRKGIELLYRFSLVAVSPLALLLFVFSGAILQLLYGNEYAIGQSALQILSIGMVFFTFYAINIGILYGINEPKINTLAIVVGSIISVVLNLILIPKYGFIGAAIAASVSYIPMMLIGTFILEKKNLLIIPYKIWLKTIALAIVFLLIVNYLNMHISLNLFLKIGLISIIAGSIYVICLFLFRLVTIDEVKGLINRITKYD